MEARKVVTIAHPEHSSGELKTSEFLSENFQLLVVKFSVYLNRHIFVL